MKVGADWQTQVQSVTVRLTAAVQLQLSREIVLPEKENIA